MQCSYSTCRNPKMRKVFLSGIWPFVCEWQMKIILHFQVVANFFSPETEGYIEPNDHSKLNIDVFGGMRWLIGHCSSIKVWGWNFENFEISENKPFVEMQPIHADNESCVVCRIVDCSRSNALIAIFHFLWFLLISIFWKAKAICIHDTCSLESWIRTSKTPHDWNKYFPLSFIRLADNNSDYYLNWKQKLANGIYFTADRCNFRMKFNFSSCFYAILYKDMIRETI